MLATAPGFADKARRYGLGPLPRPVNLRRAAGLIRSARTVLVQGLFGERRTWLVTVTKGAARRMLTHLRWLGERRVLASAPGEDGALVLGGLSVV